MNFQKAKTRSPANSSDGSESCLLTEENKKGVVSNSQQHSGAGVYMKGIKKVELIKGQQGKNISGNKSLGQRQRKHIITHCKQCK